MADGAVSRLSRVTPATLLRLGPTRSKHRRLLSLAPASSAENGPILPHSAGCVKRPTRCSHRHSPAFARHPRWPPAPERTLRLPSPRRFARSGGWRAAAAAIRAWRRCHGLSSAGWVILAETALASHLVVAGGGGLARIAREAVHVRCTEILRVLLRVVRRLVRGEVPFRDVQRARIVLTAVRGCRTRRSQAVGYDRGDRGEVAKTVLPR
jgi:hypothetical protein